MGRTGPIRKRDAERRRNNKPDVPTATVETDGEVGIPPADDGWHPIALAWYNSLAKSAQSRFYEASDWATAVMLAESISRDMKPQPIGVHPETGKTVMAKIPLKGAQLAAYLKGFTALLVTEGDRRRASVEIERYNALNPRPDSQVTSIDRRRGRLAG